jgi:hypothetical protein
VSDTVEDDIRTAFERITEPVVPRPDPLGRLLVRRRRRTWRRGIGAAAAAVALAFAGGALATAPIGGGVGPSPGPDRSGNVTGQDSPKARITAWTRRLIESPTRGNLAGDTEFVDEVTRQAKGASEAPVGLDRIKVLAIADANGGRVAVIAHYDDEFAAVHLVHAAPDADRPTSAGARPATRGSGYGRSSRAPAAWCGAPTR